MTDLKYMGMGWSNLGTFVEGDIERGVSGVFGCESRLLLIEFN